MFQPLFKLHLLAFSLLAIALTTITTTARAQTLPPLPRPDFQRPITPIPAAPLPTLPPPNQIIPAPAPPNPGNPPTDFTTQIVVKKFEITGSTVFTPAELAKITTPLTDRPIDFPQLLQVANDITQLYVSKGYINSGAFIPGNQTFDTQGGIVKIEIIEGSVEDIVVTGTQKLSPNYIKNRIALGARKPLKVDQLIESLRLLQLDPLIKSISTELAAGKEPGTSVVQLKVTENPNWHVGFNIANSRTPSVGEIQAQASIAHNNLTGLGDGLGLSYGRTEGSNVFDINYTLPLNPRNGTLKLQYSRSDSRVVEAPFDQLDINGTAQDISLTYRQPLLQTTAQEFALGLTLAKRDVNTGYLFSVIGERVGFPSPGADQNGNTRITAARFFQDYTTRDTQQVFAARSQLSVGLNILDATAAPTALDSNFLTWRGQAQYVRALAPNSILLLKVESQLADRALVGIEQIGLGGQDTVRGYRQDLLLGDNGVIASAEARFPIFTPTGSPHLLQIVPFLDFGVAWNQLPNPSIGNNTIAAIGLGLRYQYSDNFLAKLDYGVPLSSNGQARRTGQENGFYFSLNYNQSF